MIDAGMTAGSGRTRFPPPARRSWGRLLDYVRIDVPQTLLRMLPFPCRTGLVKIGNPGRDAPVLLTCNFHLTRERVRRALAGMDAYLLVANSRGVNVWCAATGGLFTNHDVISVLKTSGIDRLVDHRRLILPQLAATGIEGRVVHEKTGWRTLWGPVDARDLPAFLNRGCEKTEAMGTVEFPLQQRLEMAAAWAFPISLVTLLVWPFWARGVLPLMALVWCLSLLIFLSFPLYRDRLDGKRKQVGFIFFDFGERGVPVVLWLLFMATLTVLAALGGAFSWGMVARWGLSAFVILLILGLDLTGSTPMFKSGLHEDRLLRIELDTTLCKGAGFCEKVCPTNVFEVDYDRRMASLPRAGQCVQCGACIVQCPFDALYLRSPEDEIVTPETIRRFKLNLLGHRKIAGPTAVTQAKR